MLIFRPLIFQRNERIAITIAGARFIADCELPHERQKKADAACRDKLRRNRFRT
jgi:hypothetical protein